MKIVFIVLFVFLYTVKSKPNNQNLEDLYGPLASADDKIQNDEDEYGLEEDDDIIDENEQKDNGPIINAEFQTKPQNFTVSIGTTVKLPCEVNNSEVVLLWRKDDMLLYQGIVALKPIPNIKRSDNYLEVNITSENDYGKYYCQMIRSSDDSHNPIMVHSVMPPSAPSIITIDAAGQTVYRTGENLRLTCRAIGNPKPKISWHKDNKRLDMEGETLIIENLKHRDAGSYRCLADNKIEPPAHYNITIKIEHKPIVLTEKFIVNSDKEYDVELKCIVHAYPPASVVWKKDHKNIIHNPPKIKLERHENNVENILIISNLTDEDFGQYNCSATNSVGKVEKAINLVKTPTVQGVNKPEKVNKDVVLTWKVESKSPITEHELQYRKTGAEEWKNLKPEVTKGENNVYTVKYTLKDLDANRYEIRVRSRNIHGWSTYSDFMSVEGEIVPATPDTPLQRKENESSKSSIAAEKGTSTDGSTKLESTLSAISIALLVLFYHRQ